MVPLHYVGTIARNFGSVGAEPGAVVQVPEAKVEAFLASGLWKEPDAGAEPATPAAAPARSKGRPKAEEGENNVG